MKKILTIIAAALVVLAVGCSKDYDDSALVGRVDNLESRVSALEALCKQMNTNISSLQTIVDALQNADYITSVTPVTQNGVTIGYTITFAKNGSITIYHGTNGKDGADGKNGADGKDGYTPVIGVRQDADGQYYWTLDGEWLLDASGNKICASGRDGRDGVDGKDGKDGADGKDGKDGADGKDGKDGITPQLKIEDGYWYISYDNGATWTRLGKATGEDGKDGTNGKDGADGQPGRDGVDGKDGKDGADGKDGKDGVDGQPGADGDSMFREVTQDELNVYLTLADGTVITIPKGAPLSIVFDEEDLVVMAPNSTREIHYTVSSVIPDVEIEVVSSADIKAKVVAATATTGAIEVKTSATIDEYSKVVVFVSNGDKVIMRRFLFEQTGLQVEDNATKEAAAEGGELVLEFMSNVECEVVIPESAQSWISVVPQTRAMEKRSITLKLEPNEGHNRSATVTVQSPDGSVKLEYLVEQEGNMGAIDLEAIPDNEIWYTSIDGKVVELYSSSPMLFGATLVSNTYTNGKGILKFNAPVTTFGRAAYDLLGGLPFGAAGDGTPEKLLTIYFPHSVKTLGFCALAYCGNLTNIGMPRNLEYIGSDAFLDCWSLTSIEIPATVDFIGEAAFGACKSLKKFNGESHFISEDQRCVIDNGNLIGFAPYGISEYIIPNGIETIGTYSFMDTLIESVTFPSSIRTIKLSAFRGTKLRSISLNEGLVDIEQWAFAYTQLSKVHIPSTVETIGNAAFSCPLLTLYTGKYASSDGKCLIVNGEIISFAYNGLTSYELPSGVKKVGSNLFNSELLEYITIPEGVEVISGNAFTCRNLRTINIPSTIVSIGDEHGGPFTYCTNLESITGKYTTEDHRCLIKDNVLISFAPKGLTNYDIPQGVISIGPSAFEEHSLNTVSLPQSLKRLESRAFRMSSITTITIPESVSYIGDQAFFYCEKLSSVYIRSLLPPTLNWQEEYNPGDTFHIAENGKIYVPKESEQLYKSSWPTYAHKIIGYEYDDLVIPDYYISSDYSQDGKVVTLQKATKGNGVDVVLMGDAYSDRQIADGTYMKAMQTMADNLFSEEPYKSFKDMFNVYVVNVVSATEGYEYGNTALSGFFGGGTYVGGNDALCFQYALNAISEERMDEALIVVAMNEDAYAGTCFMYYPTTVTGTYGSGPSVAYFPTSSDAATLSGLVLHEAGGHGFSKLADEYDYGTTVSAEEVYYTKQQQADWGWWKNVDFTGDPSAVRWNYFLNDSRYANDGLGVFEGGLTHSFGVWRPTDNSIMRYNYGGFNAPSREAIYYRIHKLAYGDSWQYNYEDFVKYDEINRKAAASARVYAPSTYKPTHPPVVVNKSWRDAK